MTISTAVIKDTMEQTVKIDVTFPTVKNVLITAFVKNVNPVTGDLAVSAAALNGVTVAIK